MIIALMAVYLAILILLVKLRIVPFNLFWKVSPLTVFLLLLIGLFIPMGWGAPQGPSILLRQSVQIVPNAAGQVIDVPVEANKPIKANDVLFKIDPAPFEAQVNALDAQLKFQELRLAQMTQLLRADSGRAFDVQQRQAEVDQLRAQLEGAKYNLEQTTGRAPADGYVTNVALRKGARVANLPLAPAMAFIDTSETVVGVSIPQIGTRYIQPGQKAELDFQVSAWPDLRRNCRGGSASYLGRSSADLGPCGDPDANASCAFRRAGRARRQERCQPASGGSGGPSGHLYRRSEKYALHPPDHFTTDCDSELREPVLTSAQGSGR